MLYPFRPLAIGLLAGALLFAAPFFLRFIVIALLIGFVVRMMRRRFAYGYGCGRNHYGPPRHRYRRPPEDLNRRGWQEEDLVPSEI